jgi:glycosyltransferase involved in cell wall biosynthesis
MLSVNIPVYNVEITDLVLQLRNQAEKLGIPYEIRIYDDGSQVWFKEQNRKIAGLSNVIYSELEKNVGRAVIRNQMGHDSAFQYLLFIDADSKLVSENYLASYREHVRENVVLCGGTVYSSQKPADPQKLLRWYYGTSREAVPAGKET